MPNPAVLFISYDGILEPLGQSQVFAYARKLSGSFNMILLSFEKEHDLADTEHLEYVRSEAARHNIEWIPLRYHKRPRMLATGYDLLHGVVSALWVTFTRKVDIVHCRGLIPTAMGVVVRTVLRPRLIFDMRGLWIDEGVEKGDWTTLSKMYRIGKWIEKICLAKSDAVVSLTQAAVDDISKWRSLKNRVMNFRVISTCCDLDRFVLPSRNRNAGERFVFGYVGNVGIWYHFDAVLECFKMLLNRVPDALMLIINRNQQDLIRNKIRQAGIPSDSIEIKGTAHNSVASEIQRMHATAFFIRPSYAKIASAPTKLGELLGCGVPCLTSRGVGDMDSQLTGGNAGVLVDFDQLGEMDVLRRAVDQLLELARDPRTPQRCRETASLHFSLHEGSKRYHRLYNDLLDSNPRR